MSNKKLIIIASAVGVLLLGGLCYLILSLHQQRQYNQELEQLAAMDKKEMENEYTQFALQYDELKRSIRNDSLMQRLAEEEARTKSLLEELKQTKSNDAREISRLKKELATVRAVLRTYIIQVDSLNRLTESLKNENQQVRQQYSQATAQISSLTVSTNALDKQMAATDVQTDQLRDQLRKCHILAPTKGMVLEKYVERGEFVSTGKPLFKIADTENMYLRAYVTSTQLKDIKVGQKATVFADYGNGEKKEYQGKVTWISTRSEFTPKTILTDDERADLVYAIKVAIKGDGYVKIGMYGEVRFAERN